MPDFMKEHAERLAKIRTEHIEMMAARFVQEHGIEAVEGWVLCEQRDGSVTRWWYERR